MDAMQGQVGKQQAGLEGGESHSLGLCWGVCRKRKAGR